MFRRFNVRLWLIPLINYFRSGSFWYRGEREKCDFNNINHLMYRLFCSIGKPALEMAHFKSLSTVSTPTGHRAL